MIDPPGSSGQGDILLAPRHVGGDTWVGIYERMNFLHFRLFFPISRRDSILGDQRVTARKFSGSGWCPFDKMI